MVDFRAADLLTQLISECVLSTMSVDTTSNMPQIIQGVRLFLQNNFTQKHTLEDLGSQFNMNPQYLQKQFKRYMGMSPSEYLIFLRMTRAKELLIIVGREETVSFMAWAGAFGVRMIDTLI